mmetsp:Transcript_16227/g.31716  ORF Transcript_16227/g.31716 Transcript_16227/m.31716 type:complete len:371 (-) Transcript_16227:169-1281(-)
MNYSLGLGVIPIGRPSFAFIAGRLLRDILCRRPQRIFHAAPRDPATFVPSRIPFRILAARVQPVLANPGHQDFLAHSDAQSTLFAVRARERRPAAIRPAHVRQDVRGVGARGVEVLLDGHVEASVFLQLLLLELLLCQVVLAAAQAHGVADPIRGLFLGRYARREGPEVEGAEHHLDVPQPPEVVRIHERLLSIPGVRFTEDPLLNTCGVLHDGLRLLDPQAPDAHHQAQCQHHCHQHLVESKHKVSRVPVHAREHVPRPSEGVWSEKDAAVRAGDDDIGEEQEEVLVVVVAHAVVDPRAVVVHLQAALVARTAVVRPWRLIALTPLAELQLLPVGLARRRPSNRRVPGPPEGGFEVRQCQHGHREEIPG